MSSEDTRIVNMQINNKDFLKGTSDSLRALDTLNSGIDRAGKSKGMDNLGKSVDGVKTHFTKLQVIGATVLGSLTNKALNAGLSIAHSLGSLILDGGKKRYLAIEQAQFQFKGLGLNVEKYMKSALDAVRGTAYGLDDAATLAATFGASGIKAGKDLTGSLKGVAGIAALTGSSFSEIGQIFTAINSEGKVGLVRLQQFGLRGLNVAAAIAKLTHQSIAQVNADVRAGKISFKDFTKYADLAFGSHATDANQTYAGSLANLKAAFSRLGASIQGPRLEATRRIFNALTPVIDGLATALAPVIKSFGDLTGRVADKLAKFFNLASMGYSEVTIRGHKFVTLASNVHIAFANLGEAIGNIFTAIGHILYPIKRLISDLIPTASGASDGFLAFSKVVLAISVAIEKLTSSTSVLNPLIDAFATVIKFALSLVFLFFKSLVNLGQIFAPLGGAIGGLVSALGGLISSLLSMIGFKSGINGLFDGFINVRSSILTPIVATLTAIVDALTSLVNGDISIGDFGKALRAAFSNLGDLGSVLGKGKEIAGQLISGLISGLNPASISAAFASFVNGFLAFFRGLLGIHSPSTVFKEYGANIVEGLVIGLLGAINLIIKAVDGMIKAISGFDRFDFANLISAIFSGAVLVTIYRFGKRFEKSVGALSRILTNGNAVLTQTTSTLKTMQSGIRAKVILDIAIAVGILALAVALLSQIEPKKLANGTAAVLALLAGVTSAIVIITKLSDLGLKQAAGIIAIGVSVTLMAAGMILLAAALLILAKAIQTYAKIPVKDFAKGLGLIILTLAAVGASALLVSAQAPFLLVAAAALLVLAFALTALSGVILIFAAIKASTIQSGMKKIAGTLAVLGLAMIPLSAQAPLLLVASAALIVLTLALAALLPIILAFAKIKAGTIINGVAKIAGAIIAIGIAGYIAGPGLLILGAAALLLGVGLLAAGVGLGLVAAGLVALTAAGVGAGAVLATAFEAFLSTLPLLAVQIVAALVAILEAIAKASPRIVAALVKIGTELLKGIGQLGKPLVAAIIVLLIDLINGIDKFGPILYDGMIKLLVGMINAISDSHQKITDAATNLIVTFLNGISDNLTDIITAGTNMVVNILSGITDSVDKLTTAAGEFVLGFLTAIDNSINTYEPQILAMGLKIGVDLVKGLVTGLIPAPILTAIGNLVHSIVGFFKGLLGIHSPSTVFAGFGRNIVEGLVNGITGLIGSVGKAVGRIASALTGGFRSAAKAVGGAISDIGSAVGKIPGLITGIISRVAKAAASLGASIVSGIGTGIRKSGSFVANLAAGLKTAINHGLGLPRTIGFSKKILGKTISASITIPGFAKGVTGFRGGPAVVGENGPEVVTLGRGSNVLTNKNLVAFMKAVASLTRKLTMGDSGNFSGGKISYSVGADFQGNPQNSGVAFAANIAAGLIKGLKASKSGVNKTISGVGSDMTQSFADILGIKSPSTVFAQLGKYVSQGFINGLLGTIGSVQAAALTMAKAATDTVSRTITDSQLLLEKLQAEADAYKDASTNSKLTEAQKTSLSNQADAAQKLADAQKEKVDAENTAADRAIAFAAADTQGKADIRNEDALAAAQLASTQRQLAEKDAKQASIIRSKDKAGAAALDQAAAAALSAAQAAAANAGVLAKEADDLQAQAKIEQSANNIADIAALMQTVTAEDVSNAQAMFDQYSKSLTDASAAAAKDAPPTTVSLEQNNYSPEAISPAEAYRNAKNLIAQMERKLVPTP